MINNEEMVTKQYAYLICTVYNHSCMCCCLHLQQQLQHTDLKLYPFSQPCMPPYLALCLFSWRFRQLWAGLVYHVASFMSNNVVYCRVSAGCALQLHSLYRQQQCLGRSWDAESVSSRLSRTSERIRTQLGDQQQSDRSILRWTLQLEMSLVVSPDSSARNPCQIPWYLVDHAISIACIRIVDDQNPRQNAKPRHIPVNPRANTPRKPPGGKSLSALGIASENMPQEGV